jgi:regulatory protein
MKLTAIKQQVKNPDRVSVFIDGKYSFSLSLDELLSQKLKTNIEIDEPRLKQLKQVSADGKLRLRAMEWVLNRPRSIREFRDYMFRKKADPDLIDRLVVEFESKKYLNEEVFAKWLIDLRRRGNKSDRAIKAELSKKGINLQTAQSFFDENNDESDRLDKLISKKLKIGRYKADPQKLTAYLHRQGFSYDSVRHAIKRHQTGQEAD